ncbi:MAG: hypothetical protein NZ951_06550 [Dehalococcoidia bacterium]|nr:hypothetical protein [Dehalococcoidia bacterium]MDW8120627.1 hypothetical protein [Chloroflexota bacterium]
MAPPVDPLATQAYADSLVQRTAQELARLVKEVASALEPFPSFLGMATLQALEVEGGKADPERGCVVVCPDGELYELVLRLMPGPGDIMPIDQVEEFKPLDLPPADYIPYAYRAVQALIQELARRRSPP